MRSLFEEQPVLARVRGEEVDVVEVPDAGAAPGVALRLVLQRGTELRRRLVALGLVEELDGVAVGVAEAVRRAVPHVAVEPLAACTAGLERAHAPVERLGAPRAVGEMTDARLLRRGELQRRALVVAEAAQVDRVAALARDLHAEQVDEVAKALFGLRRQQLDV